MRRSKTTTKIVQNSFFPQRQLSRITAEHEKQLRNLASIRIRFRTDGRIDGPIVLLGKRNGEFRSLLDNDWRSSNFY